MDEFARIAALFRPLAGPEGLDLQDDAAWLQPPAGHTLIVTKDALVAGVHFLGDEDPALIARKALRVNLSDLAAMGAAPYGYLLATQLPRDLPDAWLARFCEGLREDQRRFGLALFGGDSVSTPGPMAFSVTMFGLLPPGTMPLRRDGAREGDVLCVTGTLGLGALGLRSLREGWGAAEAEARYLLPDPRLEIGLALREISHAAMDVSDGLMQDAGHMARASGMSLRIDARMIPCAQGGPFEADAVLQAALAGGDDYELLLALAEEDWEEAQRRAEGLGTRLTRIGKAVAGVGDVALQHAPFSIESLTGWRHF